MSRSVTEIVQSSIGAVNVTVAILTAWGELTGKLEEVSNQFGLQVFEWVPWLATSVFVISGLYLLVAGLSRKSRLLEPEALLIDPDNPDHLCGRREDIRRVVAAVDDHPLVFLEGESGSGKSALVRSGLLPALRKTPPVSAVLPVYIKGNRSLRQAKPGEGGSHVEGKP